MSTVMGFLTNSVDVLCHHLHNPPKVPEHHLVTIVLYRQELQMLGSCYLTQTTSINHKVISYVGNNVPKLMPLTLGQ